MSSVTKRIGEIQQPRGGYVKPSEFDTIVYDDGLVLHENENVTGQAMGVVVDYLTRYLTGSDKEKAFSIALSGAKKAEEEFGVSRAVRRARVLLMGIEGLDDQSIVNACRMTYFDLWFRNPLAAITSPDCMQINPDKDTIDNIRILVNRSIVFFEKYGPKTADGFTFELAGGNMEDYFTMIKEKKGTFGGYTVTVDSGDGDFLTADTLWDFKVMKNKPTSKHTLQLLMYWIMGQHSGQERYKGITKIGFFNPRFNTVYLLEISKIEAETIKTVEDEVICY